MAWVESYIVNGTAFDGTGFAIDTVTQNTPVLRGENVVPAMDHGVRWREKRLGARTEEWELWVCDVDPVTGLPKAGGETARRAQFHDNWDELKKRHQQTGTHVAPYMIAPYYFYYGHRFAAQAIEMLPEEVRDDYRERFRERLFSVKEMDGTWNDRVFDRSANFGTSTSILALMQPDLAPPASWRAPDPGQEPARGGSGTQKR